MKITRIEPLVVGAPTPGCGRLSNRNYIFVKVHTDEGITGLGEATLESHDHAVLGALRDLEALVLGEDPRRIEYLTQTMTRSLFWKGGVIKGSAVAGIELALWDILGKSLGEPVHRLVGGACRDKIRVYVNGWTGGSRRDPGTAPCGMRGRIRRLQIQHCPPRLADSRSGAPADHHPGRGNNPHRSRRRCPPDV